VKAAGLSLDVRRELCVICGEEQVRERDGGPIVVLPASAEEVAAVLRLANECRLRLSPAGSDTAINPSGKQPDVVLNTTRLTEVEHYDHADLTVGIGAGTTVARLQALVGAEHLLFAADPALPDRCTVGGLLATASHGPLRHGYGGVRDYCIGIRFVTGGARRAKGGGRVVKNVAGYDLMKLLIGSYGTLAVITSASFKLFPAPRETKTFLTEFSGAAEALRFRDQLMRSPLSPMCLELVSPGARKLMRPEMAGDAWVIGVRAAGSDAVQARYRKELGSAVTRELEGDKERIMWRAIEDFPAACGQMSKDERRKEGARNVCIQISVPPSDVLRIINLLNTPDDRKNVSVGFIGRVGVGHVLAVIQISSEEREPLRLVDNLRREFKDNLSVKLDSASKPWPIPPANLTAMRAVKQALDPGNVLCGREIF